MPAKKPRMYDRYSDIRTPHGYQASKAPHAYTQYGVGYKQKASAPSQPDQVDIRAPKQERYPPRDYFLFSLVVTIFCCLPLGLLSLWYVLQARKAVQFDERPRAIQTASRAKMIAIMALGTGIGLAVLSIGIIAVRASTRCEKSSWECVELVFTDDDDPYQVSRPIGQEWQGN